MTTTLEIAFDCADPDGLATFWIGALHYKSQDPPKGFSSWQEAFRAWKVPEEEWNAASAIVDPEGVGPLISFQRCNPLQNGRNRIHLDLIVVGAEEITAEERLSRLKAEAERLLALGAKLVRIEDRSVVMQDPEGNEFCVH